jgi:hypothetical protein
MKKQVIVEGALEVVKYTLRGREMGLTGIMHVEAHLLDCVCESASRPLVDFGVLNDNLIK